MKQEEEVVEFGTEEGSEVTVLGHVQTNSSS